MSRAAWAQKLGFVATNQLLAEICVFLRNIIIAQFLGAETLGEFIFLILSIRLFAMSTDVAAERYILQAKDAEVKSALATAHFVCRIRGALLAAMLLLMGAFALQGVSFIAYALLAASALVRSFTHQGYRLKQRSLNFRPALYVEGLTTILGTFAVYIAAIVLPSLEAICACLVAQAVMHTALSHAMAEEPYASNADGQDLKALFKYGFPLLLTGVAMFWSMQGERVILAAILPPAEFAHFSMMFQLALVPILVLSRIMLTIGLPYFASRRENSINFTQRLTQMHLITYVLAASFALAFVLFANPALQLLFGEDFRTSGLLLLLVATAQALRLCRAPQSVAAQAIGQTDIPFKANLVRVAFVLFAIASTMAGGSLTTLLIIACVGEGCAWAAQGLLFSLRNRQRLPAPAPQLTPQESL